MPVGHEEEVGPELLLVFLGHHPRVVHVGVADRGLEPRQIRDEPGELRELFDLNAPVLLDQRLRFGESAQQLAFCLGADGGIHVVDPDGNRNHGEQGARDEDPIRERGEEAQELQL